MILFVAVVVVVGLLLFVEHEHERTSMICEKGRETMRLPCHVPYYL